MKQKSLLKCVHALPHSKNQEQCVVVYIASVTGDGLPQILNNTIGRNTDEMVLRDFLTSIHHNPIDKIIDFIVTGTIQVAQRIGIVVNGLQDEF